VPRIVSSGCSISYDVTGSGPAVVLLHGSLLSRAIWRGHGYVQALREQHTVVRVDLRGHGLSGAPHDPAAFAPDLLAADVLAVMDAAGLKDAALMGYSLGARLALHLTLTAPERVSHLVSLGGSAADQSGAIDQIFFPGALSVLGTGDMAAFCDRQDLDPLTRGAFLRTDPYAMAALFQATRQISGYSDAALTACPLPALWMAGDRDQPRFESAHAAATMPHGHFVPLPGRTHARTLVPAGPVLEAVEPFLRS
jgi:pimeloyl-ACP methyl ester carboxylesterase